MPHDVPSSAQHPHAHAHRHEHHPEHDTRLDELLDLDGEVLHAYWSEVMGLVQEAVPAPPRRIVDLGAGTGVGALALADLFPTAEVVAVDLSPESLRHLATSAAHRGVAGRVRTVVADLDAGFPELTGVDLAWSSLAMHHLADPVRVLADLRARATPDGVIVVAEFEQALRFLPHDLGVGEPGFEERLSTRLADAHRELLPRMDSRWPERLAAAGWTVTHERTVVIDLDPPESSQSSADPASSASSKANRYALGWFSRLAEQIGDQLEPGDREVLAALVDADGPHSLLRRTDLHIRGERTITVARR
jgi:SAM-dependent methyltransferase